MIVGHRGTNYFIYFFSLSRLLLGRVRAAVCSPPIEFAQSYFAPLNEDHLKSHSIQLANVKMPASSSGSNVSSSSAASSLSHPDPVLSGMAWLHGSSICSGIFITPNRMLCPRCVCSSWQEATSLVIKRRHATDNTVLSITCDPSDCFLANNILDIVIIGVSPKFSEAAGITPVPIAWPQEKSSTFTNRHAVKPPALGPGYRLYRLVGHAPFLYFWNVEPCL